jgi:flagellar protein FlgJ
VAISPPSDIVMDVARAVEPAGLEAAKAQLVKRGGAAAGSAPGAVAFARGLDASTLETSRSSRTAPEPFVKFEAMVMQSFIQSMLPEDSSSVYGEGMSGDMWKSLMAEQMSGAIAARGGIGIADRMLGDHYYEGKDRVALAGVTEPEALSQAGEDNNLSRALVQEMQRRLLPDFGGEKYRGDD